MSRTIFTTSAPRIFSTLSAASALRAERKVTVIKSVLRSGVIVKSPRIARGASRGCVCSLTRCRSVADFIKLTKVGTETCRGLKVSPDSDDRNEPDISCRISWVEAVKWDSNLK